MTTNSPYTKKMKKMKKVEEEEKDAVGGLEAKYEEYRVKLEHRLDEERRVTDRLSALTVPPRLAHSIVADFEAFITHVSLMKPVVSEPLSSAVSSAAAVKEVIVTTHGDDHGDDDHDGDDGDDEREKEEEALLYPDLVLAATLGAALDWWSAPITQWDLKAVLKGSRAFRRRCKQLSYEELFSLMAMRTQTQLQTQPPQSPPPPLASHLFMVKRLARACELRGAWDQLHRLEFYKHPARYLLVRWVYTVTELLTRY